MVNFDINFFICCFFSPKVLFHLIEHLRPANAEAVLYPAESINERSAQIQCIVTEMATQVKKTTKTAAQLLDRVAVFYVYLFNYTELQGFMVNEKVNLRIIKILAIAVAQKSRAVNTFYCA